MLKLPIGCLQLIRANELLLHTEDEEYLDGRNLKRCMPKQTSQYAKFGYDTKHFLGSVSMSFKKLSSDTVTKAINIIKAIVLSAIDDAVFLKAMENDTTRILWFRDNTNPDTLHHLWSSQWKSVSFNFVFHQGERVDAEEDRIRVHLFRTMAYSAAVVCSIVFEHMVKIHDNDLENHVPDERKGRKIVADSYTRLRGWPSIGKWRVRLEELPAVEDFYKMRKDHSKSSQDVPLEIELK